MKIEIQCGVCQRRFSVDAKLAGKKARCLCGETIAIVAEPQAQHEPFGHILDGPQTGAMPQTGGGFAGFPSGTPQQAPWGQPAYGQAGFGGAASGSPAAFGGAGYGQPAAFGNPYASPAGFVPPAFAPAGTTAKPKKQKKERSGPSAWEGSLPGWVASLAMFAMVMIIVPLDSVGLFVGLMMFALIGSILIPLSILFHRADRSPWLSIIPVANTVIALDIIGREAWLIVLAFIPFGGLVLGWILAAGFANLCGRGTGFALGLFFLPWIFYPLLVFTGD